MSPVGERRDGVDNKDDQDLLHARYRRYLMITALLSLLVGGAIGALGFDEATLRPAGVTPPPSWLTPVGDQVGVIVTMPPTVTPQWFRVYVSGAVAQPQVVALPSGSLVEDALDAAGGALPDADLTELNLAAVVRDHDHIIVPVTSEGQASSGGLTKSDPLIESIDVNTAPAESLERLPSIGPSRASEIVAYRKAHGPFTSTEALLNVPGIGPGIYADIEPWITIE